MSHEITTHHVFCGKTNVQHFFNKFVKLFKWWPSIRLFIQIWWSSKYESRKILSTLSSTIGNWWKNKKIIEFSPYMPKFSNSETQTLN